MTATKSKVTKENNWTDIKKPLKHCSSADFLSLISELYGLSKTNKNFLEARFLQTEETLDKYKDLVQKHVAPNEPWKNNQQISLKDAKKAISDFKKASGDKLKLIDLMIHYVECGTEYTLQYGDIDEQYYCSLESVFENALKLMKQYEDSEIDDYYDRMDDIVTRAIEGWGYRDALSKMFNDAYPEYN